LGSFFGQAKKEQRIEAFLLGTTPVPRGEVLKNNK